MVIDKDFEDACDLNLVDDRIIIFDASSEDNESEHEAIVFPNSLNIFKFYRSAYFEYCLKNFFYLTISD